MLKKNEIEMLQLRYFFIINFINTYYETVRPNELIIPYISTSNSLLILLRVYFPFLI